MKNMDQKACEANTRLYNLQHARAQREDRLNALAGDLLRMQKIDAFDYDFERKRVSFVRKYLVMKAKHM